MAFDRSTDWRPGQVLQLISRGASVAEQAARVGVSRQTIARWHRDDKEFADAAANVRRLAVTDRDDARAELAALLRAWTPGGSDESMPAPQDIGIAVVVSEAAPASRKVVEPDVLDRDGRKELAGPSVERKARIEESPYTTTRPPTNDELEAIFARIIEDKGEPERLRSMAIAGLTKLREARATRARPQVDDTAVVEAARERGRDPGVPASVWQEARKNFLGPAPDAEPEDEQGGDVVEFERTPSS